VTPTTVSTPAVDGDSVGGLALSGDGSRVVYTLSHGTGGADLRVVAVTSGATVAVGDGRAVLAPVLSTAGDRVAFLRPEGAGVQAAVATVPGAPAATAPSDAVPAEAAAVIDRFVSAQLGNDTGALRALGSSTLTLPSALTAGGATRSYVIKAALAPDTGVITAQVRLVKDASQEAAASFADESLKLERTDTGYLVSAAAVSDFQTEPNGPQIVHVSSERQGSTLVVRIAFDSDLDPATVTGGAITLTGARGGPLSTEVSYEVESRTAVVRVSAVPDGPLTLAVSGVLRDIAGQSLSSAYSTTLQA
jgi:hypothetical protein